ncbi:MAG TPA: hypothetical protein VNW26_05325, partial [Steroidobacteraceae bacterium]|nr:hypothetical protein [Steroidobacteraceae bacterium]
MTSSIESQAFRTALESEIMIMEEARDALPEDSHLRTLCNLAVERLEALVSTERRATPAAGPPPAHIHANKKGRLAGTIRRIAVDPLHPTGWMFATKLSEMP